MKSRIIQKSRKKVDKKLIDGEVALYQLKISLAYSNPPIWRRLLVRGDINLSLLHAVFQVSMGWTNSHLHHFMIGRVRFTDPHMVDERLVGEEPDLDEIKNTLATALAGGEKSFIYEYDFGDSWIHRIDVEQIHDSSKKIEGFVQCIDGSRACPPEDCGGFPGYEELLKALADPKHEEHESMMEWVGGSFNPETFDLKQTNVFLRKLKWPRTTNDQLARILMDRDGVEGF